MVYILLGQGFEEMEAITPFDLLSRAGIPVCFAGIGGKRITGAHGIVIESHTTVEEISVHGAEMVVLPGGSGGVESIQSSSVALEKVREIWGQGGYVGALCAAPVILARLGIADGRQVTCYPHEKWEIQMCHSVLRSDVPAVRDGKLITGASAGCAIAFSLALIDALRGPELACKVKKEIVIRGRD